MKNRRNAVLWALGWWLVRRQLRRRAALAVADVTAGAARRSRLRAVLGAVLLVGLLAAALVAARKLLGGSDEIEAPPQPDVPMSPVPESAPA